VRAAGLAGSGLRADHVSVTLWDWSKGVTTEKHMRGAEMQVGRSDAVRSRATIAAAGGAS
jgi:hypothetical protein